MVLVRRFEERTEEQYTRARIGGYCHLAIGEEAANVGAIAQLRDSDYLFTSYRDHAAALAVGSEPAARDGRAVRQVHRRGRRLRRLDAPARRRAQLPRRLGHRRRAPADRRRRGVRARLPRRGRRRPVPARRRRDQHRGVPRVAQPGGHLEAPDRLPDHQQPVRHGHLGRAGVGRARAVEARLRLPDARRAGRRQRPAVGLRGGRPAARRRPARTASRRSSRRITYRFRGHSVADAGKLYRTKEEIDAARELDPDPPLRDAARGGRDPDGRRRQADPLRGQRRGRRGDPRGGLRPGARRRPAVRQRVRRPGLEGAVLADGRGRPVRRARRRRGNGGSDLPRGAPARARRGARARRERLPDRRGDRPLRGLVQGHRRPVQEVRPAPDQGDPDRRGGLHGRRHRRRRCSACGRSSRS